MKYRAKQIKLLTCGRTCSALGRRAGTQEEEAVALCKQIDEGGGVDRGHDGGGTGENHGALALG